MMEKELLVLVQMTNMFNEEMAGGVPFDIEEEDESGSESEGPTPCLGSVGPGISRDVEDVQEDDGLTDEVESVDEEVGIRAMRITKKRAGSERRTEEKTARRHLEMALGGMLKSRTIAQTNICLNLCVVCKIKVKEVEVGL
ncbi:hypothetical protein CJ030_MR2G027154 [Morella rubra]|uniref:Uncharacterized protein n=1 Tax=Morella rubra TaxID=262757 RepID=A0A6A1W8J6_9ROSI|nr:hypothetical protein CJ030_MR2G027154 [Morella rubra]